LQRTQKRIGLPRTGIGNGLVVNYSLDEILGLPWLPAVLVNDKPGPFLAADLGADLEPGTIVYSVEIAVNVMEVVCDVSLPRLF
jgi:hypothetical protein